MPPRGSSIRWLQYGRMHCSNWSRRLSAQAAARAEPTAGRQSRSSSISATNMLQIDDCSHVALEHRTLDSEHAALDFAQARRLLQPLAGMGIHPAYPRNAIGGTYTLAFHFCVLHR